MAKAEKVDVLSPRSFFQRISKEELASLLLFVNCKGGFFYKVIERLREEVLGSSWKVHYTELAGKEATYSELTRMLLTTPFMGKRRMIVVKETEEFWKSLGKQRDDLVKFLSSYRGSNVLLLAANGDLDLFSLKSKVHPLVQVFAYKGVVVTMKPRNREELRQWVMRELKRAGVEPDVAFMEWLVEESDGNVGFIENEIAKLSLYSEGGMEVKSTVSITRFKKEVANGELVALKSLEDLLGAGYSPLYLMGIITNLVRNAVEVYEEAKKARSLDAGLQRAKVYRSERDAVVSILKRHPKGKIYQVFKVLQDADRDLKSSSTPPQVVLTRMVLSLQG
jgi:DNA polymerase III delta subunit